MTGIVVGIIFIGAIIYGIANFLFHIGIDFTIAIIAFWSGFVFTMKERGEPIVKNAHIYSNVCFVLAAIFLIRGFFH